MGWKIRDLELERTFNDPSGIPHKDTRPLAYPSTLPTDTVFLTEGETDFLRLVQSSIPYRYYADVWCVPGANAFNPAWATELRGYDTVYCVPDGDEAGSALPDSVATLCPGVLSVPMPDGYDVCSYLMEHEDEDLIQLIEQATVVIPRVKRVRRDDSSFADSVGQEYGSKLVSIVARDTKILRRGSELIAKCPLHEESTPSFSINPKKQLWRCFGCGRQGDVISYVRERHGLSFVGAKQYIKDFR